MRNPQEDGKITGHACVLVRGRTSVRSLKEQRDDATGLITHEEMVDAVRRRSSGKNEQQRQPHQGRNLPSRRHSSPPDPHTRDNSARTVRAVQSIPSWVLVAPQPPVQTPRHGFQSRSIRSSAECPSRHPARTSGSKSPGACHPGPLDSSVAVLPVPPAFGPAPQDLTSLSRSRPCETEERRGLQHQGSRASSPFSTPLPGDHGWPARACGADRSASICAVRTSVLISPMCL